MIIIFLTCAPSEWTHSITVVPEMDFSTNDGSSSSVGKDDDEIDSARTQVLKWIALLDVSELSVDFCTCQ